MNKLFKKLLPIFVMVIGVSVGGVLGFWQLSRATQKEHLLAQYIQQQNNSIRTIDEVLKQQDREQLMYARVDLIGKWMLDKTVFLENRPMNGRVGFIVVTPLLLAGRPDAVLVQRGWTARNFNDRTALPVIPTPTTTVNIAGQLVPPPSKLYEPGLEVRGVIRQNIDIKEFQREIGVPLLDVSILQTNENEDGLLKDWASPSFGIEKHYGYAFQWFALSVLIFCWYVWYQWLGPRFKQKTKKVSSEQAKS